MTLDREQSIRNRDAGIEAAAEHADARVPDWQDKAMEYLKKFPRERFQVEDLREWAHSNGLIKPPHARAWGAVIKRAQREGLVMHIGYQAVSNTKAHSMPASVWERMKHEPS